VFACSAGGPGFDSRLRRLVAFAPPTLYAEDVGALVKPLHSGDPDVMQLSRSLLMFERPSPSHTIEVQAPCSLSRYSDLHV
jgi:hypothetical protein